MVFALTTKQGKISGLGPLRKIPVSANAVPIAVSAKTKSLTQNLVLGDLVVDPNATGGFSEAVSNASFNWKGVPVYYEITKN